MLKEFQKRIRHNQIISGAIHVSKNLRIPGFEGLPLYDVAEFFIKRLQESELQTRARALAFSFMLALFPTVIFIFTLIPYIPVASFQNQLLDLIAEALPATTFEAARETIIDIIRHQRGGLLSFGFFFALFISADGTLALMKWFNKSYHGKSVRAHWKMRLMAIGLTIILALLVFVALALILLSGLIYYYIAQKQILASFFDLLLLQAGKWVILLLLCFTAISLLYYYGPLRKEKLKFISAGSSLATFLIVVTSLGFNFFLNNFAQYNKLYGSIGTLIVILIWLYINSLVILIGYELNVSIRKARKTIPLPNL